MKLKIYLVLLVLIISVLSVGAYTTFSDTWKFTYQDNRDAPVNKDNNFGFNPHYNFPTYNYTLVDKSVTISGREYQYGTINGSYEGYFRNQFSDVKDRPVAMVAKNYTLTFTPVDFITLEPHKGTKQGKVGNRVQSDAVISNNVVTYPEVYEKIGTAGGFANITYSCLHTEIKENYVINDKAYIKDRFESQCNAEDYDIVNITFDSIIRAYDTNDEDNQTLGIVYTHDKVSFKDFGLSANGEFTTNQMVCFTDNNNETVYFIPTLIATDSNNNMIVLNKTVSMTSFGNLRVSLLVPYSWLNETAVFPVYVDPTFGYLMKGNTTTDLENTIVGTDYICAENGIAKNITVYLSNTQGTYPNGPTEYNYTDNISCALYYYGNKTLYHQTEEKIIFLEKRVLNGGWFTFNFTENVPVVAGEHYIIVAWANLSAGDCRTNYSTFSTQTTYFDTETYDGSFPSTLDDSVNTSGWNVSIYCSYETTSSYSIDGLYNPNPPTSYGNLTWEGEAGTSVWSNVTNPGGTLELSMVVNTTENVTDIKVWVDDLDATITASNITLYVSSDNSSYGSLGTFTDSGSNITVNDSTWNVGTMGATPFTYGGITNKSVSIYFRFLLSIPASTPVNTYSQSDWVIYLGNK